MWLGAGSVKAALSRPAHQRVTQAVRRSCAPPLRRGACPPNGARDPSPCSAPFLEDQESQRIVKQIRRSTARKREGHRSGADCGSPNPGKLLGLIRSAEQRDEADGAGADEHPKLVRSEEEGVERMLNSSRPRPAPAAYPAPR